MSPASQSRALLAAVMVVAAGLASTCVDDGAPLPRDELVSACVRATGCGIKPYPRVANCVEGYHRLLRAFGLGAVYNGIYRCVNGASGCDAVFRCFGAGGANASSCNKDYQASCDGSTAVSCDLLDKRVYRFDCSAAGLGCAVRSGDSFEASCSPGSCEPGSYESRCDGGRLLTCAAGVIAVEDCGAQGLSCRSDGGRSDCVGSGGDCTSDLPLPRCDGNTAIGCVGGRIQRVDCGGQAVATRCVDGGCRAAGSDCLDDFDRCAGDELQTCLDGRWATVRCADVDLGPCVPSQSGAACGAR